MCLNATVGLTRSNGFNDVGATLYTASVAAALDNAVSGVTEQRREQPTYGWIVRFLIF